MMNENKKGNDDQLWFALPLVSCTAVYQYFDVNYVSMT